MSDNEKFLILGYCVGKYLEEKGLNLNATLDVKGACSVVDFVVMRATTNVYPISCKK